jgi:hypothetical protein
MAVLGDFYDYYYTATFQRGDSAALRVFFSIQKSLDVTLCVCNFLTSSGSNNYTNKVEEKTLARAEIVRFPFWKRHKLISRVCVFEERHLLS